MSDELDARIRALEAERTRPEPGEPTVQDLLGRLIATLHAAYTTLPDGRPDLGTRAGRVAEFARLRGRGCTVAHAARRVGVVPATGYVYDAEIRQGEP